MIHLILILVAADNVRIFCPWTKTLTGAFQSTYWNTSGYVSLFATYLSRHQKTTTLPSETEMRRASISRVQNTAASQIDLKTRA
ncbi:hypothetical protein AC579_7951 [Pseudocercospora musae]|uniref:Secreted protein n=1 Tax=Pseudocercospora musae TaxID=113226 RepID=A0A139I8G3_9PEZI|nr:hypothetical protein AC579_7951 [Pseudocercospora musae]